MSVQFRPAKRENVPLLISVAGGTGSGKTFSAMRLASGIAGGARFAVIDTENGRARHYADQFDFDVADLHAPFTPAAYQEAIAAAAAAGYPVVMVDSMSHEHAGDGGLLDMQADELRRMGGGENMKMASWIKPKMEHKKLVTRLLQINAHVILCFRAEEKIEIGKDANNRTVVRPKQSLVGLDGWIPVAEKNLPYEMTLSVLLTADAPGVPKPIKLPDQFRPMVPLDQPLTEGTGIQLAKWAAGDREPEPDSDEIRALREQLQHAAAMLGAEQVEATRKWLQTPRTAAVLRRQITRVNERIAADRAPAQGELGEQ